MTSITRKMFNSSAALAFAALAFGVPAQAEGSLTVYCSVQEEWCQSMVNEFQKATGISVAMTRKSSGETFAQVRATRPSVAIRKVLRATPMYVRPY